MTTALLAGILTLLAASGRRIPALRASVDAGANASVLPVISVASLVGFGAVVAAMPAFEAVRDWVLGIGGGPLVSLAVATNLLAALTGSASGGLTIALEALGPTYMAIAAEQRIDPGLLHRIAVIGAGTLDILPHNGAVITLLAVCGCTHRESYLDIVMVAIVSSIAALAAVILLGGLVSPSMRRAAERLSVSAGAQAPSPPPVPTAGPPPSGCRRIPRTARAPGQRRYADEGARDAPEQRPEEDRDKHHEGRERQPRAGQPRLQGAARQELDGLQREEDGQRRLPAAELQGGEEGREQDRQQRADEGDVVQHEGDHAPFRRQLQPHQPRETPDREAGAMLIAVRTSM